MDLASIARISTILVRIWKTPKAATYTDCFHRRKAMDRAMLASQRCQPRKGESALDHTKTAELLRALPGWELAEGGKSIGKTFRFEDFHETLGFVNAIGWMANRQDHHPDMEVGYNRCAVRWSTHDVGGLSMNDFICAAKTEQIAAG
jgi:4a-hydroxytetrahydrobiopterin dehydratase